MDLNKIGVEGAWDWVVTGGEGEGLLNFHLIFEIKIWAEPVNPSY